jgi:hypothetical protein
MAPTDSGMESGRGLSRVLALLGGFAFASLIFAFLYAPLLDQDLWWHLKSGWLILTEKAFPRTNTFTAASDTPWIDHQWGFQILLYKVWENFGPGGVIALKSIVGGAAWAILALAASPRSKFLALLPFLAVGAVAANERMTDRPELFSYLFLALELALLLRWRRSPSSGPLALLVAVQILWANFHALSVLGVGVVGAFFAGEAATSWLARGREASASRPPLARGDLIPLALTGLACTAALAITPYGIDGALFPFSLYGQLDNPRIAIAEFMSPYASFRPTAAIWAFHVLVLAVAGILLLSLPRLDPSLLLTGLGLFILAASARRNAPLFVFAAIPLIGAHLGIAAGRLRRLPVPRAAIRALGDAASIIVIGALVFLIHDTVSGRFYARDGLLKRFGGGIYEGLLVREAMDYVIANDLRGQALNDIDSGGYFTWRAFPERRAFIDSRLEALPSSLLNDYRRAFTTDEGWQTLDGRHRFAYAVLNHTYGVNARLVGRLDADPGWALVHLDPVGLVFLRRDAAPADLLARDEIAPRRRPPPPFRAPRPRTDSLARWVRRILGVEVDRDIRPALAYAAVLDRLGYTDEALAALAWALAQDPDPAVAGQIRRAIEGRRGEAS